MPGGGRLNMYSALLVLTTYRSANAVSAENRTFFPPPLIYRFRLGWPLSNLWKSFTVLKTRVFQAAEGEDLVILACTVFDWSTSVTDGQIELRWLRCVRAVAAVARKNLNLWTPSNARVPKSTTPLVGSATAPISPLPTPAKYTSSREQGWI